ncbi:NAD(P)-dependent oxidoreductase [Arcticibacterium luteifluviistationis]|uniref:Phosphoglycerate dehydrogenase n=1 Tax=Arcticibacterium luteifluviistationis TaxID=1784714 RepID=A0A2Z4G7G1_9BACT|nr:NAD(P)-dependent oxidoreductase [Arcticibacterium luteifluviistationis]AWV96998.1 phosphoglycerate dehydrogenase [Arcticibacterium luteifluviistationis]
MRILIVDEMHPSIVEMPKALGLDVDYFPNIAFEEVLERVGDYDGLIIRSKFSINSEFLSYASKLKFIGRAGAGLDLIDLHACKKAGVTVFGANEANKVAVAEHLIGMLLSLLHKINTGSREVKKGQWNREANRGEELFGKTVGIIGYGNNGQATAERLAAFGCKILANDRYKYGFGTHIIKECELSEIYEKADIVSLHIPLTKETDKWVNADFFDKFQKPIIFCNIARGEIVELKDLVTAMKSGKVKGACLDVLENEKLKTLSEEQKASFDYLASQNNAILTPHVAGWSTESYVKINEVLRDKIKRLLEK